LTIGVLFGIITMAGFGIQDFLIAKISRKIGSYRVSLWLIFMSFIVFILLAIFMLNYNGMSLIAIALVIAAGFISVIASFSYAKGLEVGNVSIMATIANTWGAVTAVLGFVFLGEIITKFQMLDIGLIVIGAVLVSFNLKDILKLKTKNLHVGIEYAFIALFSYGLYFFLAAILSKTIGWFSTAFLIMIPKLLFMLLYGSLTKEKLVVNKNYLPYLFMMGIINVVALLSYNLGVTYNYSDIVAPVSSASPLVTIILATFFLKEGLTANQKVGVAVVLTGLILLSV